MEMSTPAPRRSKWNPDNKGGDIDYSQSTPLNGGSRPFPCFGYPKGLSSGTYRAGQAIPVQIVGSADHDGGHCQFSISYDGQNFVALQNVYGNCPSEVRNFDIVLPGDAPAGDAVFAWTWINRNGGREFYMNCADIRIVGPPNGVISGHEILLGNFPVEGKLYRTFPEGFSRGYGINYFSETPVITITPGGLRSLTPQGSSSNLSTNQTQTKSSRN
ncbi:hypothetical protein DSO57_1003328 [Entomophthora muscae]|uniref:Uncharacterized protein n=1 Tax=Entomophthora muscae TaxID=34485 RepID=A0ACC2U7N4_9FUNG|nr:hypothetical protein DSO57_1003328 [Entomophthora muscae]